LARSWEHWRGNLLVVAPDTVSLGRLTIRAYYPKPRSPLRSPAVLEARARRGQVPI
jgi:hypothetical protein